jgi:hypothetical protein
MGSKGTRRSGWAGRLALLAACASLAALGVAVASAEIVRHGGLELRAEVEFAPHELPRDHPAPIEIEGKASLRTTDGGPPPRLERVVLDFDRDGRLSTRGLPSCAPASVEAVGVATARRRCEKAIVGTGKVGALVLVEGRWLRVVGKLTLFNGPARGGAATVVAHAQAVSIPSEIYVVTVPIERTGGRYGYRATVEVPEVFNGTGVLTQIEADIDRRYRYKGRERSFVSARCSDGSLDIHGILTFADGNVIDGSVTKYCVPAGLFRP